jgi:nucleotide-binding universal stress UspA family protein|tara:strand:- start:3314 stop:4222 length:909 start_codon:yes stop_codon:yes gene_type:complete
MQAFEDSFAYCHARVGPTLKVAVAVDGSKVGNKALDLAIALANAARNPDDATLDLLHVKTDPHAPIFLSPGHIEKECELRLSRPNVRVKARFHVLGKPDGQSVTQVLAKAAEATQVDLLVVGATGLKIEKGDVHADSFTVMGSTSDGSLHRSDVSVAIVKATSYELNGESGGMTFLVATDDSPSAKLAFALCVSKLATAKDTIHVYVNKENDGSVLEHPDTVLKHYKQVCDLKRLTCVMHSQRDHTTSVADEILALARKLECDILMLGTNGHARTNVIGSVSLRCARKAKCTTIVVKDPRIS